jgi:hypothetical protein
MAIIRIYTGADGKSHFEEIEPVFEPDDDQSETAVIHPESILIAEDVTGQGHITREVGDEPRVSIFVPLDR